MYIVRSALVLARTYVMTFETDVAYRLLIVAAFNNAHEPKEIAMRSAVACTIIAVFAMVAGCSNGTESTASNASTPSLDATPSLSRQDIVSDQGGALASDSMLVNAWGLSFGSRGPAWVSSTEKGVSAVYDSTGQSVLPAVTIPAPGSVQQSSPTGQVANDDTNAFNGDNFIFVTEDGVIAGWQQSNGNTAVQRVDNSMDGANYKGVTIAKSNNQSELFAADFHNGRIDTFDSTYQALQPSSDFTDPDLPGGYAPFNVEAVQGALIVAYAKQDDQKSDEVKGPGNGFVDAFNVDGSFIKRLVSNGELNAPWGITVTPDGFTAAPSRLLIGNFGDGKIHVYTMDLSSSSNPNITLEGAVQDQNGKDLAIDGLWALKFSSGAGGFDPNKLYFTAGPDDEQHGVFGSLTSGTTQDAGSTPTGSSGKGGAPSSPYGY
jgi:uncharacterized protein (TIGR03118 family)